MRSLILYSSSKKTDAVYAGDRTGAVQMKKLGLISGSGELPKAVAYEARRKGYTVFAIGLEPLADKNLASFTDDIKWINVGKLGKIIEALKKSGITEAVMAGKVPKLLLYKNSIRPDMRAIKLLFSLKTE